MIILCFIVSLLWGGYIIGIGNAIRELVNDRIIFDNLNLFIDIVNTKHGICFRYKPKHESEKHNHHAGKRDTKRDFHLFAGLLS